MSLSSTSHPSVQDNMKNSWNPDRDFSCFHNSKMREHMAWVQAVQYVSVRLVHFTALIERRPQTLCSSTLDDNAKYYKVCYSSDTMITDDTTFTINTPQTQTLISQCKNRPQINMLHAHTHTHSGVFLRGDQIKTSSSPCIIELKYKIEL